MSEQGWTGATACALQAAMRLSNEAFAKRLDIGVRTVAGWHQKPTLRPQSAMQQILETALEEASDAVKERFAALTQSTTEPNDTTAAEHRLSADPNITAALDWLDKHAGWPHGTARQQVAKRLAQVDRRQLEDRGARRGRVDQRAIAEALATYYDHDGEHGQYATADALTSVLTHPAWLDLDCQLMPPNDRLTVTNTVADIDVTLDDETTGRAAQRLAETLALNIVHNPTGISGAHKKAYEQISRQARIPSDPQPT